MLVGVAMLGNMLLVGGIAGAAYQPLTGAPTAPSTIISQIQQGILPLQAGAVVYGNLVAETNTAVSVGLYGTPSCYTSICPLAARNPQRPSKGTAVTIPVAADAVVLHSPRLAMDRVVVVVSPGTTTASVIVIGGKAGPVPVTETSGAGTTITRHVY